MKVTGIELLQKIKDEEITQNTEIEIIKGPLEGFRAYMKSGNLTVSIFRKEQTIGTYILCESEFELVEKTKK